MPQIRLEQVSKYYQQEKKAVPAVREIDLTIEQQEFVFVTGSSGAGKSTLLNLIAGEITPTAGAVYLDNVPIGQQRRFGHPRKAGCIGYVPQISQLMRKRTIEENLAMASMIGRGRRKVPMEERIRKALCMVGLKDVEKRYPVELSLGECRRVELARAIINSPSVLVLDELTASLDEDTIWDLFHLIGELNRLGTTVIMATHAKNFVNLMRKRVITLVDGRIFGVEKWKVWRCDVERAEYRRTDRDKYKIDKGSSCHAEKYEGQKKSDPGIWDHYCDFCSAHYCLPHDDEQSKGPV